MDIVPISSGGITPLELQIYDSPVPPELTPRAGSGQAGGEAVRPVWVNELGGVTFEIGAGDQRRFVKWAPAGGGLDLAAEAVRLGWAAGYTPVPRTARAKAPIQRERGSSPAPCRDRWQSPSVEGRPADAVTAIGAGLRALHEALPVRDCPFSWTAR